MAVFDDTQDWPDKLLLFPHEIKWESYIPVPAKAQPERLDIPEAEPLRLGCEEFRRCISNGQQPVTNGPEGLRVLRILNASQRSLDNNGAKVYLTDVSNDQKTAKAKTSSIQDQVSSISGPSDYFIHDTSVIDEGVSIGGGTKIWHFSHILSGSKIGSNCNIGQNVVIGPDVSIGAKCKVQNNVSVYKGVTLEDGVFCGPSVVFTNVYNPRAEIRKMDQIKPTLVKKGATIGANATIMCGTTLGAYCFIGAAAVVTKDIPDHALVIGNPARQMGWMCECGERLTESLECLSCNKRFERKGDGIKPKA
jgi:UDP-2-acetamido-3-amino-2,3-dideoxy-glucuronate N-acetyltransferase